MYERAIGTEGLHTGTYLGQLTSELKPGERIEEFACLGKVNIADYQTHV